MHVMRSARFLAAMNVMNIDTLLKAIERGSLLGSGAFRNADVSTVLDGRDQSPFENEWLQAFKALDTHKLSTEQSLDLERLRELAYKTTFGHTSSPDLAGYVSDDFELIGRAVIFGIDDPWINGLLQDYRDHRLPSASTKVTDESLNQLIHSLEV
jgi:hypothetical protein